MGIAELARRAGVTPRTIRYYVAEGLLSSAHGQGQRRAYGPEHLARLESIRRLKAEYLPLYEIRRRLIDLPQVEGDRLTQAPYSAGQSEQQVDIAGSGSNPSSDVVSPQFSRTNTGGRRGPSAVDGSTAFLNRVEHRPGLGFGVVPQMGRIEIFQPTETTWRRVVLAPGIELSYQDDDDPRLMEAIRRLIDQAPGILSTPSERPVKPNGNESARPDTHNRHP